MAEINLMVVYNTGSRIVLIATLRELQAHLTKREARLRRITKNVLAKLQYLTDEEFKALRLGYGEME